ncbi:ABC transporter ATP-binding protein [Vibrio aestuarianus]|uniref:ABC transporter ATP-binding protein n=1 Tax=Vibrio aestuarianus TaxID=28171 RepID=A0A9X4FFR8_9VIBR|nr:ABC transporter ATP-binding protein [Vibrio aestuarianus]MDE1236363.1 ABC transporter ATP-binding protein [Vibrio aestuarianus]MDE1247248.1 ABC transporter ATP-binding protein [Vibrio aestuarianus]MDE1347707.1 ABC transporter ATP-binding protein [Vibrio aestuarianus]NGZ64305.1 ABC transporter ATP-binding protein [Vibrio aestuarianus subsp. cardii]
MSSLVEIKNLSKQYAKQGDTRNKALHDVSLELQAGQIVGLLGHNGAGKSTLIKSLLGAHHYQGDIRIQGLNPIADRAKVMAHLSYISDVNVLPDWMTVKQILRYTSGVHPSFSLEKAMQVLAQTNIRLFSKIRTLSKGMKVQLHLAIVIATDTKVLILDEPTLGLDLIYRDTFYRHLLEWFHDGERALIIASHEVSEIEHLLTDVLILKQGKVVLQDSMESISEGYFILEANQSHSDAIRSLQPLASEVSLGTTKWLLSSEYRGAVEGFGAIYTVKLADLFLALQKENA